MADLHAATERARARFEADLTPVLARALRAQGERVAAAVAGSESPGEALDRADRIAAEVSTAAGLVAVVWGEVAPAFAATAYGVLEPAAKRAFLPDWLDRVRRFLAGEAAGKVASIVETTRDAIRRSLARSFEDGLGTREAARALRREWPDVAQSRAERIVRTETVSSSNAGATWGAEAAVEAFGLRLEREWIATPDHRTRGSHAAADGQRRPMGVPFDVGGFPAMYPGDPALPAEEVIQCRCTVAFVPVEEARKAGRGSAPPERPEVVERRQAVREAYPALRARYGREVAFDRLAEAHNVSARTIERDVYGT